MLLKHTVMYGVTKIFPAVLTLAGVSIFTRLLLPEEYGIYSLTILVSSACSSIFFQWLSLGLGRFYLDGSDEQKESLLSTILMSFLGISVVVFLGCAVTSLVFESEMDFMLIAILSIATAWFDINQRLSNADLKPNMYALSLTIKSSVAVFGGYLLLKFGFGVNGVLFALIFGFAFASIIQSRYWKAFKFAAISKDVAKKKLSYGLPLTLTFLMLFIINGSGKFFVDNMIGKSALGVFSAAFDLTQYIIVTVCGVLHLAAFPLIVDAYKNKSDSEGKKQLSKSFNLLIFVSIPLVLGVINTADEIAQLFLGSDFRSGATKIIPIIAIGLFFMSLKSYYFDYAFQLAKNTKLQLVGVFSGAITSFVSTPILLYFYGLEGAAYAMCITFIVYLAVCVMFGRLVFDMPAISWLNLAKVCLSSMFMFCVMELVTHNNHLYSFFIKFILGSLVYVFSSIVLNYMQMRSFLVSSLVKISRLGG